ncbi:MAG: phosphoribosylaminoimidazolesuccinocarboxamide synthase [Deltaproteobacteria bacterium]|nr:phosphoribosylaminoimidazolesuccinocarboxamide synthase [Deltaproteobacteria bacterium]
MRFVIARDPIQALYEDGAWRRTIRRRGGTVGIDFELLRDQCERTLAETQFSGLGTRVAGKVRDNYITGEHRYLVATDRVSCFDVVVSTLPFKGQILNQLAAFWFEKTRDIARNHLIEVPDPNVSKVLECKTLPVEFVYRAYLTGSSSTSIWTAYDRGDREYCGHVLEDGMRKHDLLPEPLLTPTTKAELGAHDELISREALIESGQISAELYDRAATIGSALFAEGRKWADSRGLILVDTKYEMGLDADGEIVVIDEIHTPDSSRYWHRDSYERALEQGEDPTQLDKEYLRVWLGDQGYKGEGQCPEIPVDVRCEATRRYIEAFEQITGAAFEPNTDPIQERIRRNLGID